MIDPKDSPLALIPTDCSTQAKLVACPYCRALLFVSLDESGRGDEPLNALAWDLPPGRSVGPPDVKGGWIVGTAHGRPQSQRAFEGKPGFIHR